MNSSPVPLKGIYFGLTSSSSFMIHLPFICIAFASNFAHAMAERVAIAFFAHRKFESIWKWKNWKNHSRPRSHNGTELNANYREKNSGSSHMEIITKLRCAAHAASIRFPQMGKKASRSSGSTHYGKLNATSSQSCSQCAECRAARMNTGCYGPCGWGLERRRYLFLHARIGRFVCRRMRLTVLTCRICFLLFFFLPCSAHIHRTTLFGCTSSLRECLNENHFVNACEKRVAGSRLCLRT